MERLDFEDYKYSPIEASIHLARYMNAKPYIKGKRVLDAACGEGYGTRLIYDWGAASVVGVDISEAAVLTAEKNFGNPHVEYLVHDVEELPFPDNSFDVVVSLETVEHLNDPVKFLKEMRRVLKENGTAIISCPNDNYYAQNVPDYINIYHKRRYTWPEYRELVRKEFGEPTQWYMGNSLSGYINLPIMYCNDPDTDAKTPMNMMGMMQARRASDIEIVPQDQYVNHWVSVYYVAIWTKMEIHGSGESAAIYPVPTFFLHNDKKVPEVDSYEMVKTLESQKQMLHDNLCEAMEALALANKTKDDIADENRRLMEECAKIHSLEEQLGEARNQCAYLQETQQQTNLALMEHETLVTDHTALQKQCTKLELCIEKSNEQIVLLEEEKRVLINERDRLKTMNTMMSEEQTMLNTQNEHLAWQVEQYTQKHAKDQELLQWEQSEHERLITRLSTCESDSAELQERNRILTNERDRLKMMNSMLSEESRLLGSRVDQLLGYCNTVDEKIRMIEMSREYRFGLRCSPLLKVFHKPLLLMLRITRKIRNGFRRIFH